MKSLNILPWVLFGGLLIANVGYVGVTRVRGDEQTVTATGQVEISTAPDLFTFNTFYEAKSTDQAASVAEINTKSKEVIAGLTAAGANPAKIKTSINSNKDYNFPNELDKKFATVLNVTIESPDLASSQKLQDYFVTSGAKGTLSPQPSFKQETRKKIEFELRDKAAADAKKNAEQTAKIMGKKLGKVVNVSDVNFGGYPMPYAMDKMSTLSSPVEMRATTSDGSAPVTPGEETKSMSLTVTYKVN
jgi:uncharacterized protein